MLKFIKQAFGALLSFSESLATKRISPNNEPGMTRIILINLNQN